MSSKRLTIIYLQMVQVCIIPTSNNSLNLRGIYMWVYFVCVTLDLFNIYIFWTGKHFSALGHLKTSIVVCFAELPARNVFYKIWSSLEERVKTIDVFLLTEDVDAFIFLFFLC